MIEESDVKLGDIIYYKGEPEEITGLKLVDGCMHIQFSSRIVWCKFDVIKRGLSLDKPVSVTKPVKYYQAYFKNPDNYILDIPQAYFKTVDDLRTYLSSSFKSYQLDDMTYGLTETFIEIKKW